MATNTDRQLGRGMRLWIILSAFVVFRSNYVQCQFEGDVRLVDASQNGQGRVEIYHDYQWGTICDDTWDNSDAQVVCRQLGLGTFNARGYTSSSHGSGPIHLDGTYCLGTEYRLDSCSHSSWGQHNCGHIEDAAVECDTAEGDVRLVGGASPNQGRVEIYHNYLWGTVCDDSWGDSDAMVVCRQLGYSGEDGEARSAGTYGQGSDPIYLDEVRCSGYETRLEYCSHAGWGIGNCDHSEDAGVYCNDNGSELEGDVRLVDGYNSDEGRVEIFHEGQWGTVCEYGWDDSDARVVCRQLGYSGDVGVAQNGGTYGQGSDPIYLDDVTCSGYESRLTDCSHEEWGLNNCYHYEDAGVQCFSPATSSPATSSRVVGIMSFVGVSLSLLTLFAFIAVCYTCSQRKPAVIPTHSEQVPLSTISSHPAAHNTAAAPTSNGMTTVPTQPPMPQQPPNQYPPSTETDPLPSPPLYNALQGELSVSLPPPN